MAKTYNLYFGKDAKPVEYYKPTTPEKALQDLIDNPDAWEQYLKNHEDAINLLREKWDNLVKEKTAITILSNSRKKKVEEFEKFLKEVLGYNNMDEIKTALDGQKLPNILTSANTTIKTLKTNEIKLKGDIAFLQNQNANMVDRTDLKDAVEAKKKAVNDLGNLQNLYTPLKDKIDGLNNKWGVANLDELDAKIKQLDTNNKVRLELVDKYGVSNLAKLDEYINKVQGERDEEKQKITNAKEAFERIAHKINLKKTVIINDLTKKNIRLDLNRVKGALGYNIDVDNDSGDE